MNRSCFSAGSESFDSWQERLFISDAACDAVEREDRMKPAEQNEEEEKTEKKSWPPGRSDPSTC